MQIPRATYHDRLESRRASLRAAVQRHIAWGNARVTALAITAAAAYGVFARGWFSAWWLIAPAAMFFWAGQRLEQAIKTRTRLERRVKFYERALARLDGRWANTGGETGARFLDDRHLYARDLDLFGEASLFEFLNAARTPMGEDTLAAWLKEPAPPAIVHARQSTVAELGAGLDLREDLAVLGDEARSGVNATALSAWGEQPLRLAASNTPIWAWGLSCAGALAFVAALVWFASQLRLVDVTATTLAALRIYLLVVLAMCAGVLWRFRTQSAGVFDGVERAAEGLGLLAEVLTRLEAERFTSPRLVALRVQLDVEGDPASRRIARLKSLRDLVDSRANPLFRFVGPLLLWDLHLVYAIERWRRTSGQAVRQWLSAVGEIEALSSLAGYHYEHPDDVFPEVTADAASCFDGEGLAHPLVSENQAVRNDIRLAGDLRALVVSGSNMSGKSTLLRTVGVNAVLAQAGAPVRATRLRLTPLDIGASIRTQDSLQGGVSRFYAEITKLGSIMRRAGETPLLFLIDELLHGTNSHDRRIGAEAIVQGLVDRGAIGLVTTHDLALAHVADVMSPRAANVHFQDTLEEGRMSFDYRLRPGVVQKSNALALMRSVGLDV